MCLWFTLDLPLAHMAPLFKLESTYPWANTSKHGMESRVWAGFQPVLSTMRTWPRYCKGQPWFSQCCCLCWLWPRHDFSYLQMGDYSKGGDMVAYLQPGKEAQRNAMCCVLKWLRSAIAKLIVVAPANQYSLAVRMRSVVIWTMWLLQWERHGSLMNM